MNSQQNQISNDFKINQISSKIHQMNQIPLFYSPYLQMYQFYCFPQINFTEKQEKMYQEAAVQTEKTCLQVLQSSENSELNQKLQYAEMKEFPLPNKQKIFEIFQLKTTKKKQILHFVSDLCSEKTKSLNCYYRSIGEKIVNFKKTKEEIIKFLVRRAWRKHGDGNNQVRDKYYSQYKSMNSEYLQVIFNDPEFLECYKHMLTNFDSQFDAFNHQRFNRFYEYLVRCYINNNFNIFKASKECKSKLPYPLFWKLQIYEIAQNLYATHHLKRTLNENESDYKIFSKKQYNQVDLKSRS